MLSRHLMWEQTTPGAERARDQSPLVGRRKLQELLIGMYVPGSTGLCPRALTAPVVACTVRQLLDFTKSIPP
jgi:hypothetical protein